MSEINLLPSRESKPARPQLTPARKWGVLVVLSLALAVIILDTTILNVALSAIIRDLKTDIQSIQWVITAYSLIMAALTITGGRLGDIFGRKKMFMFGALLFAVGSFIASISTSVPMLISGESIIEGIGAALMMPATASLLMANFQGRERVIAFGVWGGIAGAAAALGPILGGYLTTHYDWRWGFRVNLFVVTALLIGSMIIPESHDTQEKPELDLLGVGLSASGLLSLVFGIIEASRYGWWHAKEIFTVRAHEFAMPWGLSVVPFFMLLGLLILAVFVWWENRREAADHTPLVSMKLFQNRQFTSGILTTSVMSLGQTGLIFALPVFLQSVRGLNAFDTGLALLPMSLALLIVAPLSAAVSKKISAKFLISFGLILNVFAYVVLYRTLGVDTTRVDLIPGLALFGVGMGLVMSQINNLTLSAVSVQQAGEASGVNNTLRQVGSTLGSAIIGTILIGTLGTSLGDGVRASTIIPDAMKPTLVQAVSNQSSNVEFGGGAHLDGNVPADVKQEIVDISHRATVNANKTSLMYGGVFALLGFFVSFLLPKPKKREQQERQTVPAIARRERELNTRLVADLLRADLQNREQGKPGLGTEVRALIDAAEAGTSILERADPRLPQARVLWDAGWGTELGYKTFGDYLNSIELVPPSLEEFDPMFPYLILVDGRVTTSVACRLLGIAPRGNDRTPNLKPLHIKGDVYWIRCQDGSRFIGKTVEEAEGAFVTGEAGLNALEGLALVAQVPQLLRDRYIDLPATAHDGFEQSSACLGVWYGQTELRWRWKDLLDHRCRAASRLV